MENNNLVIYVSKKGILTEQNKDIKKYKGDLFSNDEIKKYIEWLEEYLATEIKTEILIFGEDKEKIYEILNLLKDKKIMIDKKTSYTIEKIEELLLKYGNIEKNEIIRVIGKDNEEMYLTKQSESFRRDKKLENIEIQKEIKNIYVDTNNNSFFNVNSINSKKIKKSEEKLDVVAPEESSTNLKSIFKSDMIKNRR